MKNALVLVAVLVVGGLGALALGVLVMTSDLALEEQDKEFMKHIGVALADSGTSVLVSDINKKEWATVCSVPQYERVSNIAARALGTTREEIIVINTNDEVASESITGFVFLYPPNRAEYLRISDRHYLSSGDDGCVERTDARFRLKNTPNTSLRRLQLTRE